MPSPRDQSTRGPVEDTPPPQATVIRGAYQSRSRQFAPYQWSVVCSADAVLIQPLSRMFTELASAGLPVLDATDAAAVEHGLSLPRWAWITTASDEFVQAAHALKGLHARMVDVSLTTLPPAGSGDLFEDLVEAMDLLCSGGCPWDSAQTNATLVPYLFEECHEVAQAVHNQDHANLMEELGDLLMQVVFHARVAEKSLGPIPIELVVGGILDKLRRRQPALRGEAYSATAWSTAKAAEPERGIASGGPPSSLHPVDQFDHLIHRDDSQCPYEPETGVLLRTSMREALRTRTPIVPIIHELLAEQLSEG